MNIIMLGAPGTGKGTIAGILSENLGIPQISTGDIFRKNIKEGTELGKLADSYISKGQLVPDDVTVQIVVERLNEPDAKNGVILDGFPRTAAQAEALKKFLLKNNPTQKRIAIELNVPDDEIIKRIVNRVTCSNKSCGAIYNLDTRPPKQSGICDICGSELKKRADDNEETVRKRLVVYHENAEELLEFYRKNNALYSIYPKQLDEAVASIKKELNKLEGSN